MRYLLIVTGLLFVCGCAQHQAAPPSDTPIYIQVTKTLTTAAATVQTQATTLQKASSSILVSVKQLQKAGAATQPLEDLTAAAQAVQTAAAKLSTETAPTVVAAAKQITQLEANNAKLAQLVQTANKQIQQLQADRDSAVHKWLIAGSLLCLAGAIICGCLPFLMPTVTAVKTVPIAAVLGLLFIAGITVNAYINTLALIGLIVMGVALTGLVIFIIVRLYQANKTVATQKSYIATMAQTHEGLKQEMYQSVPTLASKWFGDGAIPGLATLQQPQKLKDMIREFKGQPKVAVLSASPHGPPA